jgi:4-hydroxy-3-methylbut-2-enyl diphosphate reductase
VRPPPSLDGGNAAAPLLWDTLTPDDIVIIPAFGATNADKTRLIRKGIPVRRHDATCMLVEKVWKAAARHGENGFTVLIHGKHEHEETKATFSNTLRHAPAAVIIRDIAEARLLASIILDPDPASRRQRFAEKFASLCSPGFDTDRHLERLAVVNQTTLLANETRAIIRLLAETLRRKFGDSPATTRRLATAETSDTLCYATQVNQDALARALEQPLDAAFVIGGKNSSNTHQLHRLCAARLGVRAHFIQSETQIKSLSETEHYLYPKNPSLPGETITRPLWPDLAALLANSPGKPPALPKKRVLITGGASCPDGVIQQVISRVNSLFPPALLRPVESVLADLAAP